MCSQTKKINILKKLTLSLGLCIAASGLVLSLQAPCAKEQVKLKFLNTQISRVPLTRKKLPLLVLESRDCGAQSKASLLG